MKIKKKKGAIILSINPKIYSLAVIRGAAYVFIDRMYIRLDGNPDKKIKIFLKAKPEFDMDELPHLTGEFENELLSYSLREQINKANQSIKELIVSRALVSALGSSSDAELKAGSHKKDPLGILKIQGKRSKKH
jgi:His-Xaa-Ser system protein HxsD